jgi:DNA-binding MarR family transcriptional regulator
MASSPVPLNRALTYRLHRLHKLTDLESQREYPAATGLTISDGRCLGAIGAFGPLSIKDLAQMANLNKGQASRAAQSLVDQGLVSKQAVIQDGRGVSLSLTRQGEHTWQKTMGMIARRNHEIFGCLSQQEAQQFSMLLDRLIEQAEVP